MLELRGYSVDALKRRSECSVVAPMLSKLSLKSSITTLCTAGTQTRRAQCCISYSRRCRTATAGKLRRVQDLHGAEGPDDMFRGEESVVEGAERALTSVSRKLDASLSVEYTVNELINEATDIANLSRIFPGKHPDFIAIDRLLIIGCRMESTLLNCASHRCHPPLAGCGRTDAVTKSPLSLLFLYMDSITQYHLVIVVMFQ